MEDERNTTGTTPGNGSSGTRTGASGAGSGYASTGAAGSGRSMYETGDYGAGEVDASSGEMRNLIADVEDLLKGVANIGDADIARLRARVTETLQNAKSSLYEHTQDLRAQATDAATVADEYVRERPWAAIGIAAAIGVAVGLLAGRRGGDRYDY